MRAPCRFHCSSQEYQAAQATLTRSFQGKFDKFVVPCVVASGDTKDRKGTEPLSFRCGALGRVGRGRPRSHRPRSAAPQIWAGPAWGQAERAGHAVPTPPSAATRHLSPHNAVYLELWCPAVAPSIVVTSDKGRTIADFGDIAVGVS